MFPVTHPGLPYGPYTRVIESSSLPEPTHRHPGCIPAYVEMHSLSDGFSFVYVFVSQFLRDMRLFVRGECALTWREPFGCQTSLYVWRKVKTISATYPEAF